MELIIALVVSIIFAVALKRPIKRYAWVFYVLAFVVVFMFANHLLFSVSQPLARALFPYMQRCLFAFGLFTVVMFIGVFPENSRVRRYLMPIRGELSIIASILTAGHVANYLSSYLAQFIGGFVGMSLSMVTSFMVSFVLVILLLMLAITSFNTVRKRMQSHHWKRLQLLAYPFYGLIYVHLLLILSPSATDASGKALFSVVVYTVVMGGYLVLRVHKTVRERKDVSVFPLNEAVTQK